MHTESKPRKGERSRAEILECAVDIASAEGLEGLTIGRLAKQLNRSKSGLFAHFGSKEGLQLATIGRAAEIFVEQVLAPTIDLEPGITKLRAMLDSWHRSVEQTHFRGGCFFYAASAEFDGRPGSVRDLIAELTATWLDHLEEEAANAQQRGELRAAIEPAQLAFECHAVVQEANWARQLLGRTDSFDRAKTAYGNRLVDAATASGKRSLTRYQKSPSSKPRPEGARHADPRYST